MLQPGRLTPGLQPYKDILFFKIPNKFAYKSINDVNRYLIKCFYLKYSLA